MSKSTYLIPILLIVMLLGCSGDGNNECTLIETESNFLLLFQACPNDGLKEVCNSFDCTFTPRFGGDPPPPELFAIINPREECTRLDRCINLDCELNGEITGQVILTTQEFLFGNEVVGVANINGQAPYDFTCSIILP